MCNFIGEEHDIPGFDLSLGRKTLDMKRVHSRVKYTTNQHTKTSLTYKEQAQELWCRGSGLAYPIRDQMPVMLEDQARVLTPEEKALLD